MMSSERDISPRETLMNKGNDSLSSFLSHQAVKRIAIFVKFIHWLIYLLTGPRQHFGVARDGTPSNRFRNTHMHACMVMECEKHTWLYKTVTSVYLYCVYLMPFTCSLEMRPKYRFHISYCLSGLRLSYHVLYCNANVRLILQW